MMFFGALRGIVAAARGNRRNPSIFVASGSGGFVSPTGGMFRGGLGGGGPGFPENREKIREFWKSRAVLAGFASGQ
jgi:hypothetical protein